MLTRTIFFFKDTYVQNARIDFYSDFPCGAAFLLEMERLRKGKGCFGVKRQAISHVMGWLAVGRVWVARVGKD